MDEKDFRYSSFSYQSIEPPGIEKKSSAALEKSLSTYLSWQFGKIFSKHGSSIDRGYVNLVFRKSSLSEFFKRECYPPYYYSLSEKERVVLYFVEAFRQQYLAKYPLKRPILLVANNECYIQKFVCTTIRPTAFLFPELIGSIEECSSFVADFISYESYLEDPLYMPRRLISPEALLIQRVGNCFEMSTLLVCLLIGEGFQAYVVSGIATNETTLNDQRNKKCPLLKKICKKYAEYNYDSKNDGTNGFVNKADTIEKIIDDDDESNEDNEDYNDQDNYSNKSDTDTDTDRDNSLKNNYYKKNELIDSRKLLRDHSDFNKSYFELYDVKVEKEEEDIEEKTEETQPDDYTLKQPHQVISKVEYESSEEEEEEEENKLEDDHIQEQDEQISKNVTFRTSKDTNFDQEELEEEEGDLDEEAKEALKTTKTDKLESDISYYKDKGRHAWVVVIKPPDKKLAVKGQQAPQKPEIFFIEPSTGFRHELDSSDYCAVDSVWNHENYFVNVQDVPIAEMNWDFTNPNEWEHFLPFEHEIAEFQKQQQREQREKLEREQQKEQEQQNENEIQQQQQIHPQDTLQKFGERLKYEMFIKHLDLITSWVRKLHIGLQEYRERYPNYEKIIFYKNVLDERFSEYSKYNGLIRKITLFDDDHYKEPFIIWEWYKNRNDCLKTLKFFSEEKIETFSDGRPDKLKKAIYSYGHETYLIKFYFYHTQRFDSLKKCKLYRNKIILYFGKRRDLCSYQEYNLNEYTKSIEKIVDKFRRNEKIPSKDDIAEREFILTENRIIVKYHYLTGSTIQLKKEFIKPPKPDYGKEILFDPNSVKLYKTSEYQDEPTQYENYTLLLQLLDAEENLKKEHEKRIQEIKGILPKRSEEIMHIQLTFHMFDPLRNKGARNLRIQKYMKEIEEKLKIATEEPDYLAPYLIRHKDKESKDTEIVLSPAELEKIMNECMTEIKTRYSHILNDLQRKYNDLTTEFKAYERLLLKFNNQFDDEEFKTLSKERDLIDFNRRVVHTRLEQTHKEAEAKYEKVSNAIYRDKRLKHTQ